MRDKCIQTDGRTSVSLMISPLVRQSFLLSSNTVFMFSIQMASTGPSNTYHFLSGVSLLEPSLTREERMPSVLQAGGGKGQCKEELVRQQ